MGAAQLAARLDRLPIGRFHRRVLYALALVFLFELGDLNTFAFAAPALKAHLGFTVGNIAFVTSSSFLGMFIGAVSGGRIADLLGRRTALIYATLFFSLFSLLNAAAWSVTTMAIARLLTGIGLSAMTVAATTYISEVMPAERRGRMQAGVMAIGLIGIPVMSFFARGVIPISDSSWRFVFLFGAIGVFAIPLVIRLPESPRWLIEHDRAGQADQVVTAIEAEITATHGTLTEPEQVVAEPAEVPKTRYIELLRGRIGKRTLMLIVVWIFQTLGFYGFTSWVPTLLSSHGFTLVNTLQFSALTTLGAVPGALLAWPISDRFGRKAPIIGVAIVTAVCGLIYGLTFNTVAIVVFGFCVNALVQTFAALLYAYTPELYPTQQRNSGNGLVYGVGRLANIAGPPIVASLFGSLGYQSVFVYIAICWAIVAITVALFGPRTGMRHLEQLNDPGFTNGPGDDLGSTAMRPGAAG